MEIWGRQGVGPGQFIKPRAIETAGDECYVVDMTGRIQVLGLDGAWRRSWRTPEVQMGKPVGLGWSRDGLLMVADTHYFRVLFYRADGTPVPDRTIGGVNGRGPGEFGFVTDAVEDEQGNYWVAEYGDFDRIQKFDATGRFLLQLGGRGSGPGQFMRPQALALDEAGQLWVADACNHRLQVFDVSGETPRLVRIVGKAGTGAGELRYPYGFCFDGPDSLLVAEFGNHRIQRLGRNGEPLGSVGGPGKDPGHFHQPWSVVVDQTGQILALDSYNHRVQCFRWPANAAFGAQSTRTGEGASAEADEGG